jgi:hypothetical protein
VKPVRQVSVSEEVESQHRRKIGERPRRFGEVMEPSQKQHSDQGCPNLDSQGVLAGPDEGADLEVLRISR